MGHYEEKKKAKISSKYHVKAPYKNTGPLFKDLNLLEELKRIN